MNYKEDNRSSQTSAITSVPYCLDDKQINTLYSQYSKGLSSLDPEENPGESQFKLCHFGVEVTVFPEHLETLIEQPVRDDSCA